MVILLLRLSLTAGFIQFLVTDSLFRKIRGTDWSHLPGLTSLHQMTSSQYTAN